MMFYYRFKKLAYGAYPMQAIFFEILYDTKLHFTTEIWSWHPISSHVIRTIIADKAPGTSFPWRCHRYESSTCTTFKTAKAIEYPNELPDYGQVRNLRLPSAFKLLVALSPVRASKHLYVALRLPVQERRTSSCPATKQHGRHPRLLLSLPHRRQARTAPPSTSQLQ